MKRNPVKLKQLVLSKLGEIPEAARAVIEETDVSCFQPAPLQYRPPWELMLGNIVKGNVCVAGDALHPMTPDLGQEALLKKPSSQEGEKAEREQQEQVEMGLKKYASERKWRSIALIGTAYMVGRIQQSSGVFAKFIRDKILSKFL
uniref:FAD-binding domain-containing protein n=1 Tax=Cucumis melo TaxID=3656 RepID=A0A9I9CCZ8_CUCME